MFKEPPKNSREKTKNLLLTLQDKICSELENIDGKGKFLHKDIKISDEEGGTFKIGTELNETIIQQILDAKIYTLNISVTNSINKGGYLLTTLFNDKNNTKDEAITEIYRRILAKRRRWRWKIKSTEKRFCF